MILGSHESYRDIAKIFAFSLNKIHRAVQAVLEGRSIGKKVRPKLREGEQVEMKFQLMRGHEDEKSIDYVTMLS